MKRFWRRPPYWRYIQGEWHRRLDYRSPWKRLKDSWRSWVNQWYDGKYLLRHGVKRPRYFVASYHAGHHFPLPEYGYAIYFKRK